MRARRRQTHLTTVSLDANKHVLATGPLRGRMVGSLTPEVLEDQKEILTALRKACGEPAGSFTVQHIDIDLKAIEDERQRRWHAFTA